MPRRSLFNVFYYNAKKLQVRKIATQGGTVGVELVSRGAAAAGMPHGSASWQHQLIPCLLDL
jgi:hypothetical protein